MHYYEARSVKEIQDSLSKRAYAKKSQLRDHMSYLEKLANEISKRIAGELSEGEVAWGDKNDLRKVRGVYEELQVLHDSLEKEKIGKESKAKGLF